jgi:hypothetical protein
MSEPCVTTVAPENSRQHKKAPGKCAVWVRRKASVPRGSWGLGLMAGLRTGLKETDAFQPIISLSFPRYKCDFLFLHSPS